MSEKTTLARWRADAPGAQTGVATLLHGSRMCNVPNITQPHALQLSGWFDEALRQAGRDAKKAARQFIVGAAAQIEGEA